MIWGLMRAMLSNVGYGEIHTLTFLYVAARNPLAVACWPSVGAEKDPVATAKSEGDDTRICVA
jgi:hypothetical protein